MTISDALDLHSAYANWPSLPLLPTVCTVSTLCLCKQYLQIRCTESGYPWSTLSTSIFETFSFVKQARGIIAMQ